MRHKSFLIRLIFLSLCLASVSISAQTKFVVESKRQTEKVDAFVREKMSENHIPGLSLAVARDGKIILAKGYGMANLELSAPANEKTAFAIYSITKLFTAVATMMLVEEGKISLEDPISKYLKDLPAAWNPVTVRQLLNHTSGIKSFQESSFDSNNPTRDYTPTEIIKITANFPLDFPSGERWEYNNTGYFLLGMLIEKVSQKSYEQFLTERIFAPLEMRDTRLENSAELIPNRADGYTWQNNGFRNAVRISPTISFSVAGLVSTVLDLAKWDAALYTEKFLKKTTLEQMWTYTKLNNGEIETNGGLGFGLTPFRGHKRVGHSGGAAGFATTITRLIDDKITVIVLTNADREGFLISDIANEIASFYFPN
ncbi:serine hydrolase domain-containing protein [soil metagenome]